MVAIVCMIATYLATLLMFAPTLATVVGPNLFTRLTVCTLLWAALLSLEAVEAMPYARSIYSGYFHVSASTSVFDALLCLVGACLLTGWGYTATSTASTRGRLVGTVYSLLVVFSLVGSTILLASDNLLSMFVSLELQSLAVYVLVASYYSSFSATGSALMYFFLGAFSTALLLLGVALVYSATGSFSLEHVQIGNYVYSLSDLGTAEELALGSLLVTVGLLFKIAAAPFHNWAPDVYDGAPTVVTMWIATMPKVSLLLFIVGLASVQPLDSPWMHMLALAVVSSLLVGAMLGQVQSRLKRLLAYSSVSHMGFLLIGLVAGNAIGVEALLFYLGTYTVTNATVFLLVLAIGYVGNSGADLTTTTQLRGLYWVIPVLSASLAVCLFSIAGVPPIAGFVAKAKVLQAALGTEYAYTTLVGVVTSVIGAVYYLKLLRTMFFYTGLPVTLQEDVPSTKAPLSPLGRSHASVVALLSLVIPLVLLSPTYVLNLTALLSYCYY